MFRFIGVIIVIVGQLVADSGCSSLTKPESPYQNFHEVQDELDELNIDLKFAELETGYYPMDNRLSSAGQHPEGTIDIDKYNYQATELLLHHLMFSACHDRELIIMDALESAKNKPEKEFLEDLYEAHSKAYEAIQKYFDQINGTIEHLKDNLAYLGLRNGVFQLKRRLEQRMKAIKH